MDGGLLDYLHLVNVLCVVFVFLAFGSVCHVCVELLFHGFVLRHFTVDVLGFVCFVWTLKNDFVEGLLFTVLILVGGFEVCIGGECSVFWCFACWVWGLILVLGLVECLVFGVVYAFCA